MTDYIPIPDAEIDPESPARSSLKHKLRDNPIAMAEGEDGRIYSPANMEPWIIGDLPGTSQSGRVHTWYGAPEDLAIIYNPRPGHVRLKFQLRRAGFAPAIAYGQITTIDETGALRQTDGTDFVDFSEDFEISGPGYIYLKGWQNATPDSFCSIQRFAMYVANPCQFCLTFFP